MFHRIPLANVAHSWAVARHAHRFDWAENSNCQSGSREVRFGISLVAIASEAIKSDTRRALRLLDPDGPLGLHGPLLLQILGLSPELSLLHRLSIAHKSKNV